MSLILASTSPRRREILALLGLPFEVIAPQFEEKIGYRPIDTEVLEFAVEKARSVATKHPEDIVIGSDTMIMLDGKKFGKPLDIDHRDKCFELFPGGPIGFTRASPSSMAPVDRDLEIVEKVSVVMRGFTDQEITDYLTCGESLDKAGAYSIQGRGRGLIESIDGDYLAAVGMPLRPIALYLRARGIFFPLDIERFYAGEVVSELA